MKSITGKIKTASLLFRAVISVFLLGACNEALSLTTQPISSPSTYKGTLLGEPACNTTYNTTGFEPIDPSHPSAKYPLFLFFIGTSYSATESNYYQTATVAQAATAAMAARGFVAVSVQYDNLNDSIFNNSFTNTGFNNKLACMFGTANPNSLIAALCARSNVNCAAGIGAAGHSQGAFMAVSAAKYDNRLNAAAAFGYTPGPTTTLAFNRLRLINAEFEALNSLTPIMATTAGTNAQDCSGQVDQCLRNDGSGWIFVRKALLTPPNAADHCWFFRTQCADTYDTIEPNWSPNTTYPFSLAATANWLAGAAVQSRTCPATVIALQAHANNNYVSAQLLTWGTPLTATSTTVAGGWEKFSCMERGNGQIALQAQANGLYVSAISSNGYQLTASSTEANATTFQYINLGGNNIELKAVSNNSFVSADLTLSGQLIANRSSASAWETFTVVPQ